MEKINAFIEEVQANEALQAELKALAEKKAGSAEIVAFANEKGFGFTEAELEQYGKDLQASGKLNEEELASIAGGGLKWKILSFCLPPAVETCLRKWD